MMLRNILSNWGALLITGVLSLILTPVLIHSLGHFYFGVWALVGSVVGQYGILELGMRTGLFRFAARFRGAQDRDALSQIFVSALTIAIATGVILVVLTAILVIALPAFFHLEGAERATFCVVMLLLGLGTAIAFPARMTGTYLSSQQRFDLYSLGECSTSVLRTLLILLLLSSGFAIIGISAVCLASSIALLMVYILLLHRADPDLQVGRRYFQWPRVRELASFSAYAFTASLGDYLRFSTDDVVISRMLTVSLVTPFSVAGRIAWYIQSLIVALGAPINARLNELDGQGKLEEMRQLFMRGTRATALLSGAAGALLWLHGKDVIRLWVGDMPAAYPVLSVLLIGYVADLAQHPTLLVMLSRSRQRELAALTLIEGAMNLALSIYWARHWGLLGVALGTAAPMVVFRMFVQPWRALRALELGAGRYFREALLRPAILGAVFGLLCWLLRQPLARPSLPALTFAVGWQLLAFAVLAYFLVLPPEDRELVKNKARCWAWSAA
jgi:O-antigen/teichoic acid export membrane protein